jgi:hypothetical protein
MASPAQPLQQAQPAPPQLQQAQPQLQQAQPQIVYVNRPSSSIVSGLATVGRTKALISAIVVTIVAVIIAGLSCILIPKAMITPSATLTLQGSTSSVGDLAYTVNGTQYSAVWPITPGTYSSGQTVYVSYATGAPGSVTSISATNPWVMIGVMWFVAILCTALGWGSYYLDTKSKTFAALQGAGSVVSMFDHH